MTARFVRILVSLLVLASLAPPVTSLAQADTDPKRLLWEWQLLEYRDDGELVPVPPGIGITALLFADTISVEGACSGARGEFTVQAESIRFAAPDVETRQCDPAAQAIDDAFYAGLTETSTWEASGGCARDEASCRPSILTLRDVVGEPVMRLTSATLPPDPGLSRWNLARIGSADGAIAPVITGVEPWVEFQRGGHVVGDSGCGSFLGRYTTNGGTISVTDIVPQEPDCTSALREQSQAILTTLGEVSDFEILPAGLVLEDEADQTRLAFVPAIDLEGRTWTPFEILDDGEVDETSALLSTSAVRFAGLQADGRSYCRTFQADQLSSGLALSVSGRRSDEENPCPKGRRDDVPEPQEIEDAFLRALQRTASHALRGDELVLMDVEGEPIMRLTPQAELSGPTWVLTEIELRPDAARHRRRAPIGDEAITAEFHPVEIGVLTGNTGVRRYDADYSLPRGGVIDISDPQTTGPGCGRRNTDEPLCVQERRFLEYLETADVVVVRPFEMRLHRGERILLRFEPAELLAAKEAAEAAEEESGG